MNKSLRRVEKLVDATNSALAQIKCGLTCDDWSGPPGTGPPGTWAPKDVVSRTPRVCSSRLQELQRLERDSKSHAKQILTDADDLLNPNKNWLSRTDSSRISRARCKMKEINEKIAHLRSMESTADETKRSRGKLSSLAEEDVRGPGGSRKECERGLVKEGALPEGKKFFFSEPENPSPSNEKPKEELKNKILETREIVDRGFHTARQLAQKVDNMSKPEKTPSCGSAAVSESRDLKHLKRSRRSRSSETFDALDSRRRSRRRVDKKKQNSGSEKKNAVLKVKRTERREANFPHLKFQRLPSLHIRGGLQLQTVHNLEILPENSEPGSSKRNTAIKILSHEKIEKEKKKMMSEKENRFPPEGESSKAAVKCSNCGTLVKMQKGMDSREIDKVLLDCDFNVFDPRIEEFAEKWNGGGGGIARGIFLPEKDEIAPENSGQCWENKESEKTKISRTVLREGRTDLSDRRLKIQELLEELSQKCKEKVSNLEDDHLRLENILQDLYYKVSRSEEFFYVRQLLSFSKKRRACRRKAGNLSSTTPVVISLAGDADVSELRDARVLKRGREKPGEKAKKKGRTRKNFALRNDGDGKYPEASSKRKDTGTKSEMGESKKAVSGNSTFFPVKVFEERYADVGEKGAGSKKSWSSGESDKDAQRAFPQIRVSISRETESDYKSDFEKESLAGDKSVENEKENGPGFNRSPVVLETNPERRCNDSNETKHRENDVEEEEKKAARTLQDRRNAAKTPGAFRESAPSVLSSPNANPNDSNESKHLKAKSVDDSAKVKNNLSSESPEGERRKSRSDASLSRKSSSAEVVASLKEILTALKDQFAKTQLLADKLTENVKDLNGEREKKSTKVASFRAPEKEAVPCYSSPRDSPKKSEDVGGGLACFSTGVLPPPEPRTVEREKVDEKNRSSESSFSEGVLWGEELSSAGEVNLNNLNSSISDGRRKRRNREKSKDGRGRIANIMELCRRSSTDKSDAGEKNDASFFSLDWRRGIESGYSEGEIESRGLTEVEWFGSHSIGEMMGSGFASESSIVE